MGVGGGESAEEKLSPIRRVSEQHEIFHYLHTTAVLNVIKCGFV